MAQGVVRCALSTCGHKEIASTASPKRSFAAHRARSPIVEHVVALLGWRRL